MPKGRQVGTDKPKFSLSGGELSGEMDHPVAIPYFCSHRNVAGFPGEAQVVSLC